MNKQDIPQPEDTLKTAMRVSLVSIIGNVILSAFKLIAGIFGKSAAMVSDAVHSLSDVLSSFVVIIGVRMASKKPDADHPYGHERFESVAAIILSAMLFVTGAGIGYGGLQRIVSGEYENLAVPTLLPLIAALVSIAAKEGMYWYARAAGKRIDSGALMADAWHHRSDALSSVGSLIGIVGARMGYPVLDSIACLVICIFILKAALDIFMDAVGKMTDKACDEKTEQEIRDVILAQEDVMAIDLLRTRIFGSRIYVEAEIQVERHTPLYRSHEVSAQVHNMVEQNFSKVKHCMVHVNPSPKEDE